MNTKLIDFWSILHLLFAFGLTWLFIKLEIELMIILITIVIYELLEHSFIGNWVFNWFKAKRKESQGNTIMDMIIGVLGFVLAIGYFL